MDENLLLKVDSYKMAQGNIECQEEVPYRCIVVLPHVMPGGKGNIRRLYIPYIWERERFITISNPF